jgi:hypothetical protein
MVLLDNKALLSFDAQIAARADFRAGMPMSDFPSEYAE